MKNKFELQYMTWKEIDEAFKKDPVIFISFGSMEQHGPHSITGDYIAADEIAKRAAERSGNYCIPVIPFGYSEYFRPYPGTISVRPTTIYSVAEDICTSLIEHGIKKIIIINGHAGNSAILDILCRDIRRERKLMIGKIDLWQAITPGFREELYGKGINPGGHGGEPLTSVMHYLRPDDMRMDLLGPNDRLKTWEQFEITNISKTRIQDGEMGMYFDMNEVTPQGSMGDPYIGNAETGKKIIERLTGYLVEFAEKMSKSNMEIK